MNTQSRKATECHSDYANISFTLSRKTFVAPQSSGTVTGTVNFYDGTTILKTVGLSGGAAKFTTSTLASGTHCITDALARDVIVPLAAKAGVQWHGWHAFRRGLATNLYRLSVSDKAIQRILRQANVGVTQACYIKTADVDATTATQQLERSLEYAPSVHLPGGGRPRVMQSNREIARSKRLWIREIENLAEREGF